MVASYLAVWREVPTRRLHRPQTHLSCGIFLAPRKNHSQTVSFVPAIPLPPVLRCSLRLLFVTFVPIIQAASLFYVVQ